MATTLVPGTHTGWNIQKWQRTVEEATYQKLVFIPSIDEGDRPFNVLNIRKHARVSATALGSTAAGTSLTYSVIIGTTVQVTPSGNYVGVEWSENLDAQMDINLDAEAAGNIEQALAESTDQTALSAIQSLTQIMSQATVDATMFRQAHGRLMGNTNGLSTPGGKGPKVYAIFTHKQLPALSSIPEFNSAELRGDSENPYVKGIWMNGGGVFLMLSTVVANDANGDHNAMYLASAFVTAWNVRSRIKRQDDELANRVIVFNHFGAAVKHDLRAISMRTTASAL